MKRLNATPRPISRNLLIQLRVFGVIFLGMLAVLVYDALIGAVTVLAVAGGLVLGFAIGVVLSRTYTLSYDEEAQHVAGRIDWVGGVILLLYIGFSIFRGLQVGRGQDVASGRRAPTGHSGARRRLSLTSRIKCVTV